MRYKTQKEKLITGTKDNFKYIIKNAMAAFGSRLYWRPTRKEFYKKLEQIQEELNSPPKCNFFQGCFLIFNMFLI